eukprot:COSAG06_NODE_49675_length_323_cov_2.093750_1_plen_98_part_10
MGGSRARRAGALLECGFMNTVGYIYHNDTAVFCINGDVTERARAGPGRPPRWPVRTPRAKIKSPARPRPGRMADLAADTVAERLRDRDTRSATLAALE